MKVVKGEPWFGTKTKKSESTGARKRGEHCTVYAGSWNQSFLEKLLVVN